MNQNKLKHNVDKDFTIVPNIILREKGLSVKAKGLWICLISLKEDWNFSVAGLAALHKDKQKSIQSGIDELIEHGYLLWDKKRDDVGRFTVVVTTTVPDKKPHGKTSSGQKATWQKEDNKELKNKELNINKELKNNNTPATAAGISQFGIQKKKRAYIMKLAYDFMEKQGVTIINNAIFQKQLVKTWGTNGDRTMLLLMTFLRDCYKDLANEEYAPQISDYLDISRKTKSLLNFAEKHHIEFIEADFEEFRQHGFDISK